MLKDINYSSHSLYRLLENLLTWTKTNWDGVEPDSKPVLIQTIIENNLDIYRVPIGEKNIQIEKVGDGNISIDADIDMLNTLFRNLFSNALGHTVRNGALSIQWAPLDRGLIQFKVINTGPSIKQSIADEISNGDPFDPKRQRISKGLGLRLAKAISNLNHWNFNIRPIPEGTCVSFEVPKTDGSL